MDASITFIGISSWPQDILFFNDLTLDNTSSWVMSNMKNDLSILRRKSTMVDLDSPWVILTGITAKNLLKSSDNDE